MVSDFFLGHTPTQARQNPDLLKLPLILSYCSSEDPQSNFKIKGNTIPMFIVKGQLIHAPIINE